MLSLYGVTREEAKTLTIARDFSSPQSPVEELDVVWQAVMAGETRLFEWQTRRPRDGEVFPVQVFLRRMPLQDRMAILASVLDITEQKAAEEGLREAWKQAEAANRIKSEFLANMSHELRTPLNGILGYTQLMRQAPDLSPKHREAVDIIHDSGEHLLSLINDVLDMSRIEARKMVLEPRDFNLPIFLKNIAAVQENMAVHKGIGFEYDPDRGLPDGVRLLFTVSDTGIGIPADQLDAIFVPFQQAASHQEPFGGAGLGLAISRQLAHLMGGEITVESKPGEGSVFVFEVEMEAVPLAGDAGPVERQRLFTGYGGERRTLLVADDRETNRKLLSEILTSADFKVVEAVNGEDALKKATQYRPDMIIMDLMMPVMDGFEATRRIRLYPDIGRTVVMAVSASVIEDIRERRLGAGCDDYLVKPIRIETLMEKIGRHLNLRWVAPEGDAENGPAEMSMPDALVPPPMDQLETLMGLARSGDVMGLAQKAARLAETPTFRGFGKRLKNMADNLEVNNIKRFIADHLAPPDDA